MDNGKPLQIQAYLTGMKTMTHSWRLAFDTMENIPPERISYFMQRVNKLGWLTFSVSQVEVDDIVNLPEIKTDFDEESGTTSAGGFILNLEAR